MNTKILKYELFGLFFLTIITLVVFYYRDGMPDNYLTVSSESTYSFFSYYTTSFMNFINYYSGPWLFIPCSIYTIFYVTTYSKRADWVDTTNLISLVLSSITFIYLFSPSLIGGGLSQMITTIFSPIIVGLIFVLSASLFFWGTFRSKFLEFFSKGYGSVITLKDNISNVSIKDKIEAIKNKIPKKEAINSKDTSSQIEDNSNSFKIPFTQKISKKNRISNAEELSTKTINLGPVTDKSLDSRVTNDSELEEFEESSVANEIETQTTGEFIQEMAPTDHKSNLSTLPLLNLNTLKDKIDGFDFEDNSEDEYVDESEISTFKKQFKTEAFDDNTYYDLVKTASTSKSDHVSHQPEDKYFHDIIFKIESKLAEFKITGQIINVLKGPVVDTFEWELGVGEKVSRLTSISEDLTLALSGAPIRMVYPMKGRTTVGIEVPRNPRDFIFLDEIISTKDFASTSHMLPLAMGKDAFGEPVVVDLASMPHMLVAGSTGAGKSVFINSVLVSLLIKKSPNQMKLILIDPKQLELALYARLPHLIMPVITDPKTAATSLLWACQEMERRYSIMSEFGVRNIEGFNHKLKTAPKENIEKLRKFYEYETEDTYELPFIVVIVDEFADLILSGKGKEIETHINRLAAKARAAGIHLIVATQRPSVDVITGVIKSNFPTRVSFRVTSSQDSRTILNAMGAEKLLGKGDMLYKYGVDTTRIHSAFIDEAEIEMLADRLSELAPTFNPYVMEFLENGGEEEALTGGSNRNDAEGSSTGSKDEKYEEAVKAVLEHRSASASLLQRRLGVGYNRAANLIDELEANGIIGPAQGSKPRKVLMGSDNTI